MSLNIPTFIYKDLDESTTRCHNKVWNWYLNNLKLGEFERILNNHNNINRLNKLIDELDNDQNNNTMKITLIMIVPNLINSTNLLQDLLSKFFAQSSPANQSSSNAESTEIIITNLGFLKNSQSSIIMATNHTNYTPTTNNNNSGNNNNNIDTTSQNYSFGNLSSYNQTIELNSVISGESGYTPSNYNETTSTIPTEIPTTTNSLTTKFFTDDHINDDESSINSFHPSSSMLSSPKYSLTRVATIQNEDSLTQVTNNSNLSNENSPIIQVDTKESTESEDPINQLNNLNQLNLNNDVKNHDFNSIYSNDYESSIISSEYVPSMITTRTKKLNLRYKLILNNILFRNIQNGEKRTAIRQINEDGIVGDDWLLYDQNFRMDNLELLDLNEIIELMKYEEKILFYDLIFEKTNEHQEDEIDEDDLENIHDNDLSVVEFNGKDDDQLSDDDDDDDDDYDDEGINSIKFVQSNQTTVTPSIGLTKTNTTNTIKTRYSKYGGSIKSEINLYKPDSLFSKMERSKSTPLSTTKKKMKLKLQKHHQNNNNNNNNHQNSEKSCIIS